MQVGSALVWAIVVQVVRIHAVDDMRRATVPPVPAVPRRVLLRAKDSVDEGVTSPLVQTRPDLPLSVSIAQASDGHAATVFYVGDANNLWRWPRNDANAINEWQQIVPGEGLHGQCVFFEPL